jgi:transcriptional regulator with XRE-family HTH domain
MSVIEGSQVDLGSFLRTRRGQGSPPAPRGVPLSRRQVPGLRRQEVAEAAGISVEYYTRLEQGRAPRPSRDVLRALATTFALTGPLRDHLYRLAGEVPPEPASPDAALRPGLARMLEGLGKTVPITVHDGRLDVVARNAAAAHLLGPLPDGPHARSIVRHAFLPRAVEVLGDNGAADYAEWAVAELASALARYPRDEALRSLVAHLAVTYPAFRALWARGDVGTTHSGVKTLRDGTGTARRFHAEMLQDPGTDHWVVIYTPIRDVPPVGLEPTLKRF